MHACPNGKPTFATHGENSGRTQHSAWFSLKVLGNSILRRYVYSSAFITRMLYRCRLLRCGSTSFWELGTLAMRKALSRYLRDGIRVLEIGAGPYATLSLWAASRWRLEVTATDIEETWVEWARAAAAMNGIAVKIAVSDLFANVSGSFDAVCFVPPHTPEVTFDSQVRMLGVQDSREAALLKRRSCGGKLGWEIIDRFYAGVGPHLAPQGRVFLAVNLAHQEDQLIKSLISLHGLAVSDEVGLGVLPYKVYVARATE